MLKENTLKRSVICDVRHLPSQCINPVSGIYSTITERPLGLWSVHANGM